MFSAQTHLMGWTFLNELQVAADVLLVWPWHQQLRTHWNTHTHHIYHCYTCTAVCLWSKYFYYNYKLIWGVTFPHHPRKLPRNVSFWDGRGRRFPVAGWRVVALKALYSCILLLHRIGCLFGRCGSRLHLSLSSSGWGVGFYGCDDDLLKFLQGVPDVPAFEDILWKVVI